MASVTLQSVLERARADGQFYQLLQAAPTEALAEYELSPEERQALQQRDRATLVQLGAPIEWVEWFAVQH